MDFRIKELCKEKGRITDVGLHQSLQGNPTIGTLEKIAAAFGVSVPELFEVPKEGIITCPHCGKSINLKTE